VKLGKLEQHHLPEDMLEEKACDSWKLF